VLVTVVYVGKVRVYSAVLVRPKPTSQVVDVVCTVATPDLTVVVRAQVSVPGINMGEGSLYEG
jgi:hypothetical protein